MEISITRYASGLTQYVTENDGILSENPTATYSSSATNGTTCKTSTETTWASGQGTIR